MRFRRPLFNECGTYKAVRTRICRGALPSGGGEVQETVVEVQETSVELCHQAEGFARQETVLTALYVPHFLTALYVPHQPRRSTIIIIIIIVIIQFLFDT